VEVTGARELPLSLSLLLLLLLDGGEQLQVVGVGVAVCGGLLCVSGQERVVISGRIKRLQQRVRGGRGEEESLSFLQRGVLLLLELLLGREIGVMVGSEGVRRSSRGRGSRNKRVIRRKDNRKSVLRVELEKLAVHVHVRAHGRHHVQL
jgi:hypothetical protein